MNIYEWSYDFERDHDVFLTIGGEETPLNYAQLDTVALRMLESAVDSPALPPVVERIDQRVRLCYPVTGYRQLSAEVRGVGAEPDTIYTLLAAIAAAIDRGRDYLLEERHYVLNRDLIFVQERLPDLRLVYLPVSALPAAPPVNVQLLRMLEDWKELTDCLSMQAWRELQARLDGERFGLAEFRAWCLARSAGQAHRQAALEGGRDEAHAASEYAGDNVPPSAGPEETDEHSAEYAQEPRTAAKPDAPAEVRHAEARRKEARTGWPIRRPADAAPQQSDRLEQHGGESSASLLEARADARERGADGSRETIGARDAERRTSRWRLRSQKRQPADGSLPFHAASDEARRSDDPHVRADSGAGGIDTLNRDDAEAPSESGQTSDYVWELIPLKEATTGILPKRRHGDWVEKAAQPAVLTAVVLGFATALAVCFFFPFPGSEALMIGLLAVFIVMVAGLMLWDKRQQREQMNLPDDTEWEDAYGLFPAARGLAAAEEQVDTAPDMRTELLAPPDRTVLLTDAAAADGQTAPRVWLIVARDGYAPRRLAVDGERFTIGRASSAVHYVSEQTGVSRLHCELVRQEDSPALYALKDLGSRNGTSLNDGGLVPFKLYPLRHGDRIRILNESYEYVVE